MIAPLAIPKRADGSRASNDTVVIPTELMQTRKIRFAKLKSNINALKELERYLKYDTRLPEGLDLHAYVTVNEDITCLEFHCVMHTPQDGVDYGSMGTGTKEDPWHDYASAVKQMQCIRSHYAACLPCDNAVPIWCVLYLYNGNSDKTVPITIDKPINLQANCIIYAVEELHVQGRSFVYRDDLKGNEPDTYVYNVIMHDNDLCSDDHYDTFGNVSKTPRKCVLRNCTLYFTKYNSNEQRCVPLDVYLGAGCVLYATSDVYELDLLGMYNARIIADSNVTVRIADACEASSIYCDSTVYAQYMSNSIIDVDALIYVRSLVAYNCKLTMRIPKYIEGYTKDILHIGLLCKCEVNIDCQYTVHAPLRIQQTSMHTTTITSRGVFLWYVGDVHQDYISYSTIQMEDMPYTPSWGYYLSNVVMCYYVNIHSTDIYCDFAVELTDTWPVADICVIGDPYRLDVVHVTYSSIKFTYTYTLDTDKDWGIGITGTCLETDTVHNTTVDAPVRLGPAYDEV